MVLINPEQAAPRGLEHPAWVTQDLIQTTLRVWQPYYDAALSRQDAIAIILAASQLVDALPVARGVEAGRARSGALGNRPVK